MFSFEGSKLREIDQNVQQEIKRRSSIAQEYNYEIQEEDNEVLI